ncbi:hypothetical protein BJ170DRAFT_609477 [Xylariales sp. AK1849]|nr:hypothetical protein BJ170DRAFT_609477 [Xylariales sp. AK1849]
MDFGNPAIVQKDDAYLELLSEACLPRLKWRGLTRALRPERPECASYLGIPRSPAWTRALQHIQTGILLKGGSEDGFCRRLWKWLNTDERTALRAVATIIYDQECSGVLIPEAVTLPVDIGLPTIESLKLILYKADLGIQPLIEHMLLVDYGIGVYPLSGESLCPTWLYRRFIFPGIDNLCKYLAEFVHCCRHGQLPDSGAWQTLGQVLESFYTRLGEISDIAIMLYYYHTHHRRLTPKDYEDGVTGYTGIMQELKDEVSTRGPDRLMRKLSVDVNYLIPNFIFDNGRKRTMVTIAESIAEKYNICIYSLDTKDQWVARVETGRFMG